MVARSFSGSPCSSGKILPWGLVLQRQESSLRCQGQGSQPRPGPKTIPGGARIPRGDVRRCQPECLARWARGKGKEAWRSVGAVEAAAVWWATFLPASDSVRPCRLLATLNVAFLPGACQLSCVYSTLTVPLLKRQLPAGARSCTVATADTFFYVPVVLCACLVLPGHCKESHSAEQHPAPNSPLSSTRSCLLSSGSSKPPPLTEGLAECSCGITVPASPSADWNNFA